MLLELHLILMLLFPCFIMVYQYFYKQKKYIYITENIHNINRKSIIRDEFENAGWIQFWGKKTVLRAVIMLFYLQDTLKCTIISTVYNSKKIFKIKK